jgi:hypothetical protein
LVSSMPRAFAACTMAAATLEFRGGFPIGPSAEIGVHRLQSIAPEVMETFSPASCPASYALESK